MSQDQTRSIAARTGTAVRIAGALLATALVVAACGGGEPEKPRVATLQTAAPATGPAATSGIEADPKTAYLDFARCMREKGIDFPDPRFDGAGKLMIGPTMAAMSKLDVTAPSYRDAVVACGEEAGGIGALIDPEQQAELRDSLVAFATCMRANGVDMPDPKLRSDGSPILYGPDGMAEKITLTDPKFLAGMVACREELGRIPVPGMSGSEGA